jgi:hypothetical protein
MTATASNITATTMDSPAAFFIIRLVLAVIYHADGSKEKRYSQAEGMLNGKLTLATRRQGKPPPSAATMISSERSEPVCINSINRDAFT